jgi:hypothetical protein
MVAESETVIGIVGPDQEVEAMAADLAGYFAGVLVTGREAIVYPEPAGEEP